MTESLFSPLRGTILVLLLLLCYFNFDHYCQAIDVVNIVISNTTNPTAPNPIPTNFISFSHEIYDVLNYFGTTTPKNSYINLVKNLVPTPNVKGANIRIGGNSADRCIWNPNRNITRPSNYSYTNITYTDLNSYKAIVDAINGSLTLSVCFRLPTAQISSYGVSYIRAIDQYLGWNRVYSMEIGNECDLYTYAGNDNLPPYRPANWTFYNYVNEFDQYAAAIYNATPTIPHPIIQGAVFALETGTWANLLPSFILNETRNSKTISQHAYPLSCTNPSIQKMLSDTCSVGNARLLVSDSNAARSVGKPFLVAEMGVTACGAIGVVDKFASALWMVDILFNYAAIGISGANMHSGSQQTLLGFSPVLYTGGTNSENATILPLYYGMYLFALSTSNYAQLLQSNQSTTSNSMIKFWITRNAVEGDKVVVIHKDVNATTPATVTVTPAIIDNNRMVKLAMMNSTRGYNSSFGISLGGQTFDGSTDGNPIGDIKWSYISPDSKGNYVFTIQPVTMAYMVIPPPTTPSSSASASSSFGASSTPTTINSPSTGSSSSGTRAYSFINVFKLIN